MQDHNQGQVPTEQRDGEVVRIEMLQEKKQTPRARPVVKVGNVMEF